MKWEHVAFLGFSIKFCHLPFVGVFIVISIYKIHNTFQTKGKNLSCDTI